MADGLRQISTHEIQRRGLVGIQSAKEIGPAFAVIQEAGWIAAFSSCGIMLSFLEYSQITTHRTVPSRPGGASKRG